MLNTIILPNYHKNFTIPRPLPVATERYPYDNPFFSTTYLPDTYFPHLKRSLIHRPFNPEVDDPTTRSFKRRRVGQSPVEHRDLCELKRVERENEKLSRQTSACGSHANLISMPVKVLKHFQKQDESLKTLRREHEEILEQISEFSRRLTETMDRLEGEWSKRSSRETKDPIMLSKAQFETLLGYHSFVVQLLNNVRGIRLANGSSFTVGNQSYSIARASSLPNPVILSAFETLKHIRAMMLRQLQFDCNEDLGKAIDSRFEGIVVDSEYVFQSLAQTEKTLVDFLKRVRVSGERFQNVNSTLALQQSLASSCFDASSFPVPLHCSTPIIGNMLNASLSTSNQSGSKSATKRNNDTSVLDAEAEYRLGLRPLPAKNAFSGEPEEVFKKKKLSPKRVSFAEPKKCCGDDMDIDL